MLKYLETSSETTLLQLSCKLCMLFLLLSAQSCQTSHLIELSDIKFTGNKMFIATNHLLKQSKLGKHLEMIVFKSYSEEETLCIVKVLSKYLKRTESLRTSDKLLISTTKPYGPISKSTFSHWVKLVMTKAGIDLSFKPHCTRSAATSKAKLHGIPLEQIMKTAGWSNARFLLSITIIQMREMQKHYKTFFFTHSNLHGICLCFISCKVIYSL